MYGIRKVLNRRKITCAMSAVLLLAIATMAVTPLLIRLAEARTRPLLYMPIGGTLNPGQIHYYWLGEQWPDTSIEVLISWTPGNTWLRVQICRIPLFGPPKWECRMGYLWGYDVHGGVAHLYFSTWAEGYWAVKITNLSNEVVTYNGGIRWYPS